MMSLTATEVFDIARDAVKAMRGKHDEEFTFPFDLIWTYSERSKNVPSLQRPGPQRRLIKEGFIEDTGEKTRAASEKRAGSTTTLYRFGPTLVNRSGPQKPAAIGAKTAGINEPMKGIAESLIVLQQRIEDEGYILTVTELANFYLAMMVSPMVILSGISGTGKSLLPRKFAEHTGAAFAAVPVQPQWADNSDLFGYIPSLAPNTFVEGKVIQALRDARSNANKLFLVLLDEMNLAPVEHYFSDFLSVAETRRRDNGNLVTDRLPIDLPPPLGDDRWGDLRDMHLPHNLRIVGTANMDETTKMFSPKVLDRSFSIEFDDPDLTAFAVRSGISATGVLDQLVKPLLDVSGPINVFEAQTEDQVLFAHIAGLLNHIQEILAPAGVKFGYRTRDAILMYVHHWKHLNLGSVMSDNAALDFCILQKVLPKIGGTGEALGSALDELSQWLGESRKGTPDESPEGFNGPFERSAQKLTRMKALLDSDGATHFWGT